MGWFGGSPSKTSSVTELRKEDADNNQVLLEDLAPKFEDKVPTYTKPPTYADAFKELKLSDFTFQNFISIPCFREAILTGFQAMGVLGVVTFLIHKNPSRSMNWGMSGFFLGNVVGWEQCRSIRRKSFQTVEAARVANQEKVRKKLEVGSANDEVMEKFNKSNSER